MLCIPIASPRPLEIPPPTQFRPGDGDDGAHPRAGRRGQAEQGALPGSEERLRETLKLLHQKLGSYENIVKFIKNLVDNPSLRQRMYCLPIEDRMLKIGHFVKIRAKLRLHGIL